LTKNDPSLASAAITARGKLSIAAYLLITVLYFVSLYLYVPTLPNYVGSQTDSLALVGLVLAQYGLWMAIIRLPVGIAADWLGRRKPFVLLGIGLAGVGAWLMGTANGTGQLIAGRAITGLAAGTWVPLIVIFSSLFPPHEAIRATAILTFAGSAGRMAATGATGTLNRLGGYSLAFTLAAGAALLGVLAVSLTREVPHPTERPSLAGIRRLVTRRDVLVPALLAAVGQYAEWAVTFGFQPILAKELGATDVWLSLLASMHIGVVTLGSLLTAAIVRRAGARRLAYGSFVLLSAGIALAALAHSLALLFGAQLCIAVAQGLSYPLLVGMSIQDVAYRERTTAMGMNQSVYAIGMFVGPWLSGLLANALGIRPMYGLTAFACLVAGIFLVRLLPKEKPDGALPPT
jgi:MFS family permease